MITVSAVDTNGTGNDVHSKLSDTSSKSTVSYSQSVNDNTLNDKKILSSNKKFTKKGKKSANPKTSSSDNFKDLQVLIDKTGDSGKLSLSKDYAADRKLTSIDITKSINIDGNGHTLDAKNLDRIFDIDIRKSKTVKLSNIIFINGKLSKYNGGAIRIDGGTVIIKNCTFKENIAGNVLDAKGGAIFSKKSNLIVEDSTFISNTIAEIGKEVCGGAIAASSGTCIIKSSDFRNNHAGQGGAIWSDAKINISSSYFSKNQASHKGGAVYAGDSSQFISNIFNDNSEKSLPVDGGAIYINGKNNYLRNNLFQSNTANYGGAILINGQNTIIDDCKFVDNPFSSYAVYCNAKDCYINNSYFVGNSGKKTIKNVYSKNDMTIENSWWGNDRYSTPRGIEGNVTLKKWKYLDVLDFSKGNTLSDIQNISAELGGKSYFEPVFVCKENNKTFKVDDSLKLNIISADSKYPLLRNAKSTLIRDGNILKICYEPKRGKEGSILINLLSHKYEYKVKHIESNTYASLDNLIKDSKGKVKLTQDYAYNKDSDNDFRDGIIVRNVVIEGNGHTIDAKGSKGLFDLNGAKVTLKNLNIKNCLNCIKGSGDIELVNCTITKTKNSIGTYGNVNLINSTIKDESSKAIKHPKNNLIKITYEVVLNNSKIINAHTSIYGENEAFIYNSSFVNVRNIVDNTQNVIVDSSKFSNCGNIIRTNGDVTVNNSVFDKLNILFSCSNNLKFNDITKVKIQNSLINNSKSDNELIDAYKNDLELNNCTFTNIDSKKLTISLDECIGTIHDCSFVNNKGATLVDYDVKNNKKTFKINNNIFLNNSYQNIFKIGKSNIAIDNNWFGNTLNNKNKKLIKDKVNNWMLLDVHYNNQETAIIIELDELYNKNNKKVTLTDGINTILKVSIKNHTKEVILENGRGLINIEDNINENETVTVDYYSNKFTFVLNKNIGTFNDLQTLIDTSSGNVTLSKNYKFSEEVDQKYIDGIKINKSITINGNGVTIDCNSKARGFNVDADNVVLTNIKIINGKAENGGAIIVQGDNAVVNNSTFSSNFAENNGGAIYSSGDNITLNGSIFDRNYAVNDGMALYLSKPQATITNNIFTNNQASKIGSSVIAGPYEESFYKNNNTFENNTHLDYGGSDNSEEIVKFTTDKKPRILTKFISNKLNQISKITVTSNGKTISITDNQITIDTLNQIFNMDFTNGHLIIYIDGKLVFNGTTTDNLSQLIYNLMNLISGNHEIRVEFTDSNGKTNTYTETITI